MGNFAQRKTKETTMKKVIALFTLTLAMAFGVAAQSAQTQNEFSVGYSFLRQDVTFSPAAFRAVDDRDSHGVSLGYTRYMKNNGNKFSNVGFTADLTANFNNERDVMSMGTLMGGVMVKARNSSYVQPYARAMVGAARQNMRSLTVGTRTDYSAAVDLGAGLDFNVARDSRYKIRVGGDWVNTGFAGERQNSGRATVGFVF